MPDQKPKIIVLTPIKNEDWILDRFLAVTSRFADHIIVSDQCSSDGSRDICRRFDKVKVIQNRSPVYDEAERQVALIQSARDLVPGRKIILALDADEILAADALHRPGWQTMLNAEPGTVLFFEKPDLYITPNQCKRYELPWPIGYVDDGAEHTAKKIHSIRVPMPSSARRLAVHDVKIMHYAWTRRTGHAAKIRLYSVIENVQSITPFALKRRARYRFNEDYANVGHLQATPQEWLDGWEAAGIDMQTICSTKYFWQDFEVLRHFARYGTQRFFFDDIWSFNWEACRQFALTQQITGVPGKPIVAPSLATQTAARLLDISFSLARKAKQSLLSQEKGPEWL